MTPMNELLAGREICPGGGHAAGRALLRALYRQATGQDMPSISLTERGKPYFQNNPYHFSITHTKNHVFCALADTPIGIDAEELDREINPLLAERILSPKEYAQYQAAPDSQLALLTFWVLKEAQAKCSGQGLTGYPNHTEFSLDDPRVTVREGCLLAVIKENDNAV